jgi:hypothetical protein
MVGAGPLAVVEPTLVGYISQAFAYWNLDLIYTVQIVASKFHDGRLVFCNHTGRTAAGVPLLKDALGQYATVIEANALSTTTEVRVPYRAYSARLRVPVWDSPVGITGREFSMGEASLRVLTSLRCPATVSQSVDVIISFSAAPGPDGFTFPRQISPDIGVINPYLGTGVTVTAPTLPVNLGRRADERKEDYCAIPQMDGGVQGTAETPDEIGVHLGNDVASVETQRPIEYKEDVHAVVENQLGYIETLQRDQFYKDVTWSDADPALTGLEVAEVPRQLVRGNVGKKAFESFIFSRGTLRVTVQLQSQAFQQGLLYVGFIPLTSAIVSQTYVTTSRTSLMLCPHVLVGAGGMRTVSLDIPFVHNKDYLDHEELDFLGSLWLTPFSPLQAGPTAAGEEKTARLSIFYSFHNLELKVIDPVDQVAAELDALKREIASLKDVQDFVSVVRK